ncbi:ABC transporter permease [Alkalispirochaeta alkalica]|uniref:ABC transporter permease n=1 Tax=Alkalispirochaeta alkalica TaxID=46356 RepID=UPI0003638323|nr:ABC transporter permease [Alkalispirochaeta alkalica]
MAKHNWQWNENLRELGLLLFMAILVVAIQIRNPAFLTAGNLTSLLTNTAILAILALGMMLVLVTRGIDLSIGSTIALAGMVTSLAVARYPGIPPVAAIGLGTAVGALAGMVVGLLVSRWDVLPIIATLGMMNVLRGLTYVISGGRWVSSYQMSDSFKRIATGRILGVNNLIVIALLAYLVAAWFINHTRLGRQIYAVGSNPEAAEVSGLPKRRLIFLVYTIMGSLAGLAGVLWVAKFASAQGDTATGYELQVIAACILGGVSINGGVGRLTGLFLGTVMLGIIANALPLINVSPFWQMGIQGGVVLAAVLTNVMVRRNTERTALRRRVI